MQNNTEVIATGFSGLVGSRVSELLNKKYSFANLDLTTGVNITREKDVKNALREASGEVLVHMAAFTDVDAAFQETDDRNGLCYKINVLGSKYVAQYCRKYSKYLIHISTDFVFDGKNPPKGGYTEKDSPNPIEWYGKTKHLAEQEIKKAAGDYCILRIAFPFRAFFPKKTDIVRSIIIKLREKKLYPMFSDQIITPTFIDDIARAIHIVIKKKPKGIFHLVGSTSLSPYLLSKKIAEIFGFNAGDVKKSSLDEYLKSSKRPYQKFLAVSNKKARRELGIKMSTIDEALKEVKKQISKFSSDNDYLN